MCLCLALMFDLWLNLMSLLSNLFCMIFFLFCSIICEGYSEVTLVFIIREKITKTLKHTNPCTYVKPSRCLCACFDLMSLFFFQHEKLWRALPGDKDSYWWQR